MTFTEVADHIKSELRASPFVVEVDDRVLRLSIFDPRDPITWVADLSGIQSGAFAVKSWNGDLQQCGLEGPLDAISRLRNIWLSQDRMIDGLQRCPPL